MDYLCECNNDPDRREALKQLPPDLPSSYERILERVNRSSRENQELVEDTALDRLCRGIFSNGEINSGTGRP